METILPCILLLCKNLRICLNPIYNGDLVDCIISRSSWLMLLYLHDVILKSANLSALCSKCYPLACFFFYLFFFCEF